MSNKKYTLTIYVAAPGTPLFDIDTGKPQLDEATGQQKTSQPGHVFYGISEDGGRTIQSYGFAPPENTDKYHWYHPDKPGDVQKGEHKEYRNPVYERTMEITAEQYKALQKFGENPQNYGFNRSTYNWTTNSCIDFTFTALYRSGIYKGKEYIHHFEGVEVGRTRDNSYEGTIKVLPNIEEFDKIPNQIPGSNLNHTIKREMPSRTFGQWLISENEREQPYQYAQADSAKPTLRIEDMPQYAQNIYHQGKECFVDFCRHENIPYREEDLDRIGMSMAAAGYAQGLRGVSLIDVNERTREISIAHESPDLNEAVVNMDKAAVTPTAESLNQIQQTAQQFEYEEQQRQYAQSQSRGMVLS